MISVRKCNLSNPVPAVLINNHLGGFIEVQPGLYIQPGKKNAEQDCRQMAKTLRSCLLCVLCFFI